MSGFQSILFDGAAVEVDEPAGCLVDLNLDQVFDAIAAGREEHRLQPLLWAPLADIGCLEYRQEVMRDLERPEVRGPVDDFARRLRRVRESLAHAESQHCPQERQRWFLHAGEAYCEAVVGLREALLRVELGSRGLRGLRQYLSGHVSTDGFASLAADSRDVAAALARVRYSLRIDGSRVTVDRYAGETDYSAEVEETFARFKQGAVKDYRASFRTGLHIDHVEAQVLERVARLHPEEFGALERYCVRHRGFVDGVLARFDREVQLCLGYLEAIEPCRSAGLPFCYPQLAAEPGEVAATQAFDLALARKLAAEGATVVCNDFRLTDPERIIVVTGPNQGGKTTFARMFGQLHYLAGLGLPVPGSSATLMVADRVFTHFERGEDLATLRGRLEDELFRLREILEQASAQSVIVMNESFTSTTLRDAIVLGTEVVRRVAEVGSLCVCVTFVDELASLGETVVSMAATVPPDDPSLRTYEVVRKPADGLAYALAIAEKYGVSYESLRRRLAS